MVGQGWTGSLPWRRVLNELLALPSGNLSLGIHRAIRRHRPGEQPGTMEPSRKHGHQIFEDEMDAPRFLDDLRQSKRIAGRTVCMGIRMNAVSAAGAPAQ